MKGRGQMGKPGGCLTRMVEGNGMDEDARVTLLKEWIVLAICEA
jgi:hypothetical protein